MYAVSLINGKAAQIIVGTSEWAALRLGGEWVDVESPVAIGSRYDAERCAFVPLAPFDSWVFDETSWTWRAPVEQPSNGGPYSWNEDELRWDKDVERDDV